VEFVAIPAFVVVMVGSKSPSEVCRELFGVRESKFLLSGVTAQVINLNLWEKSEIPAAILLFHIYSSYSVFGVSKERYMHLNRLFVPRSGNSAILF
jgi:hypothetical protein